MNHSVTFLASTVWCSHHLRRAQKQLRHPSVALRAATRVPLRHSHPLQLPLRLPCVRICLCWTRRVSGARPRVGLCDGLLPPSPVQSAAGVSAETVQGLDGAGQLVHASAELPGTRVCRCLSPGFTSLSVYLRVELLGQMAILWQDDFLVDSVFGLLEKVLSDLPQWPPRATILPAGRRAPTSHTRTDAGGFGSVWPRPRGHACGCEAMSHCGRMSTLLRTQGDEHFLTFLSTFCPSPLSIFAPSCCLLSASQVALGVKNPPASAGDTRALSLIPGWGRSPGGGNGSLLQYSCLENPMDR